MIKECKVIDNNKIRNVIVFDFNGKKIQMHYDLLADTKTVFVKYENGQYTIVTKAEYNNSTKVTEKKIKKAKETELVDDVAHKSNKISE